MRTVSWVALATLAAAPLLAATTPALAEVPVAVEPGHVPQPAGLYQGALHGYTPNEVTGGTVVTTDALAKLIKDDHPLLLDVAEQDRKPPSMRKDMPWFPIHRTIPGAIFLQGGGSGTSDPGYEQAFKSTVAGLTGDDKTKPVVAFCHPDCWGSYNAARRLIGLGYTHVYWYREGTEGWQADHGTLSVQPDAEWTAALAKDTGPDTKTATQ